MDFRHLLSLLRDVPEYALLLYGIVRFSHDIREIGGDFIGRLKRKEYQVKATTIKNMIYEDRIETIKLRKIRAYRTLSTLTLDPVPRIIEGESPEQRTTLSKHFSVPGRTEQTPGGKLSIHFEEDECLKGHKDHAVMVGYTVQGHPDVIFKEPGILVTEPVGNEVLVVGVYFPPGLHYQRNEHQQAKIEVYTESDAKKVFLPQKHITIEGDSFDFGGTRGETDWLRVTIKKPPQHADINVDWFWTDESEKMINSGARTEIR